MTYELTTDDVILMHDLIREQYPNDTATGHVNRQAIEAIVQGAYFKINGTPIHITVLGTAAYLLECIMRIHPFTDGNKRTALLVADTYLTINNVKLYMPTNATKFLKAVAGTVANKGEDVAFLRDKVYLWLEKHSGMIPNGGFGPEGIY